MPRPEHSSSTPTSGTRVRKALGGGRVRAALSLGIVLGLGAVGTMAAWSDTATATSGVFSVASIDLQLNNNQGNPAYAFTTLNKTDMMPGDSVQAALPIQNKGTAPFSYTMSASATGDATLAGFLKVTVLDAACANQIIAPTALSTSAAKPIITVGRNLAPSTGSETLCFRVALDPTVTVASQNKTVNVSFAFAATTA
ncbi:TasA family protein [Rhodococcus sp. TAF43]|uniref:TasA family protein n=1 Tax=unclassified Rhodococcus (in: high G+C Gram-positive bacteria) TaxID=192944 RepID=UPI001583B061|nr:TasA family protein [Rhodococcus sp. W8901]QKT10299.1 hypothetical protein HUN07_05860 [Rhodococcus sp. W8901]